MYLAHIVKSDDGERIQTVAEHLSESSELCGVFAGKIGMPQTGKLGGLMHDFGKYSSEFQEYIRLCTENTDYDQDTENFLNAQKGKIDHSTAGAQFLLNHCKDKAVLAILSECIVSHHSGLIDAVSPGGVDKLEERLNKDYSRTFYTEALSKCDKSVHRTAKEIIESGELEKELRLIIGTLPKNPEVCRYFALTLLVRFLFSCVLDADRTGTIDFEYPDKKALRLNAQYPSWQEFADELEEYLQKFKTSSRVDKIRHSISEQCLKTGSESQGIYTLTVPTGGGKTLAGLRFAIEHAKTHGLDRIFYIIPYTSIIDQNAREVRKILKKLSDKYSTETVLEHHSNLTPENETTAQRLMAENWDAPIVFTTMVQFLDSLFSDGTKNARRMHSLARSVIIFDEIQCLPLKTVHMFNNAVNFLVSTCKSSVLLCTATQPLLHKVEPINGSLNLPENNEIISDTHSLFKDLERVEIIDKTTEGLLSEEHICQLAAEELARTGSVLIIVNTRKSARNLYTQCRNMTDNVYHLSTDMCPAHRLEHLDRIRELALPESNEPVICISTQLIEAGVDVDFGTVIRYCAGLDSIAQAAGRCNRSGKRETKGRVYIVKPEFENTDMLHDIKIGISVTERILNEYHTDPELFDNSLLSPKAMDRYFYYYFFSRKTEIVYPVNSGSQDDSILEMLSRNHHAITNLKNRNGKNCMLRQSFKSAYSNFQVISGNTQGVIVPYKDGSEIISELCASKDIKRETGLLRKAQRYSVNIFTDKLQQLPIGALHEIGGSGIMYLNSDYYSTEFGMSLEPVQNNSNGSIFY